MLGGNPELSEDPDSESRLKPDIVAVDGGGAPFVIDKKGDGQPVYTRIPYDVCPSLVEVKSADDRKDGLDQAESYTYFHLHASPNRPGVYCLNANPTFYQVSWADANGPISSPEFSWTDLGPLAAYLYSLYVPPIDHCMRDLSIYAVDGGSKDGRRLRSWTIEVGGDRYEGCQWILHSPARGRRTNIFQKLTEDGGVVVIKDYYRGLARRFPEEDLLKKIHKDGTVPGVVRILGECQPVSWEHGKIVTAPRDPASRVEQREKIRIALGSVGTKLTECTSLMKVLKTFFDLNEGASYVLPARII